MIGAKNRVELHQLDSLEASSIDFTGERIVPGSVSELFFREHEARYVFAGDFVKGKEVLDVACGTGIGTSYLHKAGARSCIGLDIDDAAVAYARSSYPECVFERCEATELCLSDASVDVVVSFETIEHLNDCSKFLRECLRVLRPSGVLLCSTPNRKAFQWEERNPYHVTEFAEQEFTRLLEASFPKVSLYAQNMKNYPLWASRRIISRLLSLLHLKDLAKQLARREPESLCSRRQFEKAWIGDIAPLDSTWLEQPQYFVAVCSKDLQL